MRAQRDGSCVLFDRAIEISVVDLFARVLEMADGSVRGSCLGENRYGETEGNKCEQERTATHGRPSLVEARPPGALRCGPSMMQLGALQGDRTCVVIRASLLSQVATRLSIFRWRSPGSKTKTTELEKSYKEIAGLWICNTVKR